MKKLALSKLALIAVICLALGMSACGGGTPASTAASSTAPASTAPAASAALAASSTADAAPAENKPEAATILKMSSAWGENSAATLGGVKFGELIYEATNGKYDVKVYPQDQLASGNQISAIEMIQNGDVELDLRGITLLSSVDERFTIINMPFLLPTYDDVENVFVNGPGAVALDKVVAENNLISLGYGCGGYRQILNSKVDIHTPADIQGLKIRVVSAPMLFDYYNAMGANTVSMNMSEVYSSLQQGVIDGQENGIDTAKSYNIYEVTKYVTCWNGVWDGILFNASPHFWDTLSDEEKTIFQDCAKEAMQYQRELARSNETAILEDVSKTMTVTYLTAEEVDAFRQAAAPIYEKWSGAIGEELLTAFGYTA